MGWRKLALLFSKKLGCFAHDQPKFIDMLYVVANPFGQLLANAWCSVSLVQQNDGSIVSSMTNGTADGLVDTAHTQIFIVFGACVCIPFLSQL